MVGKKKLQIGAIIRSSGERTTKLCVDSIKQHCLVKNVKVINESPFQEAMKKGVEVAKQNKFNWYLLVDADAVLIENWRDIVEPILDDIKKNPRKYSKVYEIDFDIKDRFIDKPIQRAVYLVNQKTDYLRMKCLDKTYGKTKPEGSIRHEIEKMVYEYIYIKKIIAYHGFMQYKADIFNRFALRACRNPEYISRFNLFAGVDRHSKEVRIAKLGWSYGVSHKNNFSDFMNANKKINIEKMGYEELKQLKINLKEFYSIVGEF